MIVCSTSSDIEWQRGTTSDIEWYSEWQRVLQRVTMSGTARDNEWQRVTKNDNEWQWMVASDKTNEYEWE